MNKVDFGLVKADLLANYEKPQENRINVDFEWIRFMLGPLSFKKVRSYSMHLDMQTALRLTEPLECKRHTAGRSCASVAL